MGFRGAQMMIRVKKLILISLTILVTGCVTIPLRPTPQTPQEVARALEQENFDLAMAYYKAGMLEEALHFFKEVLKLNPDHTEAKQLRDKILEGLKKEESIPPIPVQVPTAGKKAPPLPQEVIPSKELPPLKEKEGLPEIKEIPEIKKPVEKKEVKKKPPSLPELPLFEFAKELRAKKLYDDAITELSNLLKDYPETLLKDKITLELAATYFDTGQYDKALKGAEEIMAKKNEFEHDAHLIMAKCYEKMGQVEKAGLEYLRLIKRLSVSPPPKVEEEVKEMAELKLVIEKIPPIPEKKEELSAQAHLGAGNVYRAKKEYRNAIVEYDNTIKTSPRSSASPEAAFYIADIYDSVPELRDYERAVKAYTKVIIDYPDSKWIDRAKERRKYLIDNYL